MASYRKSAFAAFCLLALLLIRPVVSPSQAPALRLKTDVRLALIPVQVSDPSGAAVTSLSQGSFRLMEDGVEQKITYFAREDAPLSVGFLLDTSQSMRDKMEKSLEAAGELLRASHPEDEFFLVEFNERPRLAVSFTRDLELFFRRMAHARTLGRTSLLDAVQLGLQQEKKAQNVRKAIVILSDGGDNHSRATEKEIRKAVQESDVLIYAIGLFDPHDKPNRPQEERDGPRLLSDLAVETGGRHYPVESLDRLAGVCARIGVELRNQYLLGYSPSNALADGKYRQVKVQVEAPRGTPPFRVRYRPGYTAPAE